MSSSAERLLARTWHAHTAAEFVDHDPDRAVAQMTDDVVLVHAPLGIGGAGKPAEREILRSLPHGASPK